MRVGERAELICAPEYAFGEAGSPPLIPANATVRFDITMLSVRDMMSSNNTETVRAGTLGSMLTPSPRLLVARAHARTGGLPRKVLRFDG